MAKMVQAVLGTSAGKLEAFGPAVQMRLPIAMPRARGRRPGERVLSRHET
jgi:hypothetical protein